MKRLLILSENFEKLIKDKYKDIEYKIEDYANQSIILNNNYWHTTDENYVPKNFNPGSRSEESYPLPSDIADGFFEELKPDKVSYLLGINKDFTVDETVKIVEILKREFFDLVESVVISKVDGLKNIAKKENNMKRLAGNNEFIESMGDLSTSSQMEQLLKKQMQSYIDRKKDDWSFELDDEDHTVSGTDIDNEFEKFFEGLDDGPTIEEFFGKDIPATQLNEFLDYLHDSKLATAAYNDLEDAIEEAKNEWLEMYNDEGDNAPYGPGMSQKDFI